VPLFAPATKRMSLVTVDQVIAGASNFAIIIFAAHVLVPAEFGLFIAVNPLQAQTPWIAGGIVAIAGLLGLVPALAAYRRALAEGLNQRL
jgi:putative ABC transport system permease protein